MGSFKKHILSKDIENAKNEFFGILDSVGLRGSLESKFCGILDSMGSGKVSFLAFWIAWESGNVRNWDSGLSEK